MFAKKKGVIERHLQWLKDRLYIIRVNEVLSQFRELCKP